jgi:hypothetical protein
MRPDGVVFLFPDADDASTKPFRQGWPGGMNTRSDSQFVRSKNNVLTKRSFQPPPQPEFNAEKSPDK